MALYTVSAGGTISAADLNQVVNLLTGTTSGVPVTLQDGLTVNGAAGLTVGAGATFGASVTLNGTATDLTVGGSATINNGLTVTGTSNLVGNLSISSGHALGISGSNSMAWDKGSLTAAAGATGTVTFTTNFNGRVPAVAFTVTAGGGTAATQNPTATNCGYALSGGSGTITVYWTAIG